MRKLIVMTGAALALVLLAGDQARAETWQRQWPAPRFWIASAGRHGAVLRRRLLADKGDDQRLA
jgi:hypothetical protein